MDHDEQSQDVAEACDKQVKRGFRSFAEPQVCGISFERLPAWLWILRLVEWSDVWLSAPDNARIRQSYPTLYHRFGSRWKIAMPTIHEDQRSTEACVWGVSGTLAFIKMLRLPKSVPVVCWVTNAPRRTPSGDTTPHQWLSISHANKVGGTTTARGVFRLTGVDDITVPRDLTRTLSHVVKFSVRSSPCPPVPTENHYKLTSKLSIQRLDLPIVVPSDFSATGWGQRRLEDSELAVAFELPDWISWDPQFQFHLIPLQLLRVVMDQFLLANNPRPDTNRSVRSRRTLLVEKEDQHWLASLGRWLPGSWADVVIADKAVKSDAAAVNVFPWHQRITLMLPCSRAALDGVTMLAMRRWRRNIIRSFFRYLGGRYGVSWCNMLRHCSKRARVSDVTPETCGIWWVGSDLATEMMNTREELLKDLRTGLPILGQVLQSSWWEWSSGSTLFFWRWNGREQISAARDGMRIFVHGPLPRSRHMKPLKFNRPSNQVGFGKDRWDDPTVLLERWLRQKQPTLLRGPQRADRHSDYI